MVVCRLRQYLQRIKLEDPTTGVAIRDPGSVVSRFWDAETVEKGAVFRDYYMYVKKGPVPDLVCNDMLEEMGMRIATSNTSPTTNHYNSRHKDYFHGHGCIARWMKAKFVHHFGRTTHPRNKTGFSLNRPFQSQMMVSEKKKS